MYAPIPNHLVEDFIKWSGGLHPSEATKEERQIYLDYAAPKGDK